MLQEMKQQLIKNIKETNKNGELTTHRVYEIIRDGVAQNTQKLRDDIKDLREISRESVTITVQSLMEIEDANEEKISAALHGAVDGIKQVESQILDTTHKELGQVKKRLSEEEAKLAKGLNETFEGAREAAGNFTEKVKTDIETALTDARLNNTELLGLTRETVKEAVKQAIETGKDVKGTVVHITSRATEKALKEGRFRADRMKEIVEKVISGAVEAAEETDKEVKIVVHSAFEGTQKGIASAVESVGNTSKEFLHDDLARTKEDLETIEELFAETVLRVARNSRDTAKSILTELVEHTEKTTSILREKTDQAAGKVAERLKEVGKEVTQTTGEAAGKVTSIIAEEAMKLGKRSMDIAKGAISGMLQGAKDALHKENDD